MSLRIGCGLSTDPDPRVAAIAAGQQARASLQGESADAVCVFFSGHHLVAPEATVEGVHEALAPPVLIGCGAAGVLGDGREIERGTAVAVWAASLGDGHAELFHAEALDGAEGRAVSGLPDLTAATAAILLPDPSFPTDAALGALARSSTGTPVLGGVASARTVEGGPALLLGEEIRDGAVGLTFHGVEVLPCVSQGAAPIGPELTVTASEGRIVHELAGRPALERLRDTIESLEPAEQRMVAGGLLLGIVINGGKPEYLRGDFLVRGLLGADPETGSVAVTTEVDPGTVVRLHARDATSADRDLRNALGLRRDALGGSAPAGALLFSCNGRGSAMFSAPDHDIVALREELGDAPTAGFFAAGEIGPIGGEPFLHSFTATVAVFPQ